MVAGLSLDQKTSGSTPDGAAKKTGKCRFFNFKKIPAGGEVYPAKGGDP